jgi:vanillate O-demethylase ferredoxin subunit
MLFVLHTGIPWEVLPQEMDFGSGMPMANKSITSIGKLGSSEADMRGIMSRLETLIDTGDDMMVGASATGIETYGCDSSSRSRKSETAQIEGKLELIVRSRRSVADGVIAMELVAADGSDLPVFDAGSHIDVHVNDKLIRQYSLCNDPAERHRYVIGVLREVEGRGGSEEIHRTFHDGTRVSVGSPRNAFPLVEHAGKIVLVAGGIGVTPLLAMAYSLHARGVVFDFHYCGRARSRMAFLDEIERAGFADWVRLYCDASNGGRRLDPDIDLPKAAPGTHLYVCGPNGFMNWLLGSSRVEGYAAANVHVESFTATQPTAGESFAVECNRSGVKLVVRAGETIADALIAAGIDVPLSCQQGICGACLTAVVEGTPEHHDMYQTDEEKAANSHITVCCSRSLTAKLVLDL